MQGGFTERLARAASRRPRLTVAAWAGVFVVSLVLIPLFLPSALGVGFGLTNEPESEVAEAILESRLPERQDVDEIVVVRAQALTVDDDEFRAAVVRIVERLLAHEGVASAVSFYDTDDEALVSDDRRTTLVPVDLSGGPDEATENIGDLVSIVEEAEGPSGLEAFMTGQESTGVDIERLSQHDLQTGELAFGVPAAMIILALVFGTLVGAVVPLLLAGVSIVTALALTALLGQVTEVSVFAVNMITGMGLALGIDYSLFVLSRYREERAHGAAQLDAIDLAGATASRAVFFSGFSFVVALFAMLLTPLTVLRSLAAGAILVGIVAVAAALTLVPALLGLLGDRVNAVALPVVGRAATRGSAEGGFWSWSARQVMARPAVSLVLSVAVLLAAAVPVLDLRIGAGGVSTLPDRYPSKQGFLALERDFPRATTGPAQIVVDGEASSPSVQEGLTRLQSMLADRPDFGTAEASVVEEENLAVVTVPVRGDPLGAEAADAVRDLRRDIIPAAFGGEPVRVLVGGRTAEAVDYFDATTTWLPRVFAIVLGLSFILLMLAFRSIVVPLKAIVLNLLSVGAAYGLLVLVFQKGVGADLLGFRQVDAIEAWVPLFLFSVLFGLSMDYHLFLLSRIRERFTESGDNREAVAYGVGSTARLITGAALIIIAVFIGFALGDLVMFQQMGFGVAVALFLDATVIRSVLVPSSMVLLGERNWYLPSWLEWLPELSIEGPRRPGAGAARTASGEP